MFFNIYNLFIFLCRFIFRFFFFLRYLFPYFYSIISSFLNKTIKDQKVTIQGSDNYLILKNLKTQGLNFNSVYKNIINSESNINSVLLNWYTLKKIIHQNGNLYNVAESLYLLSYLLNNHSRFKGIKLLPKGNFFNFQAINASINKLNINSRSGVTNKQSLGLNFKKVSILIHKPVEYIQKIIVNRQFKNWSIKFNSTSIDKLLSTNTIYNILFIRNFKVFNKGRYSRNRQYYRTGVYWCLYINIVAVVGMYYWFYRFTMNFGYLWWLFYFFILTFFFSRFIKFNIVDIKKEVILVITWLGAIIENLYLLLSNLVIKPFLLFLFKNNLYVRIFKRIFIKLNNSILSIYLSIYKLLF